MTFAESCRAALARGVARREQYASDADARVAFILDQVPDRIEREARVGRTHAMIMSVGYEDFNHTEEFFRLQNTCRASGELLRGDAFLVWNKCREAGWDPTLEFWHDGTWIRSGWNIVIHWSLEEGKSR